MSAQPGDQPVKLWGLSPWGAAILLAVANFLAVLDTTIANVSVPNIAASLGASSSQGAWVITSYAVAEAITVPLTGWLAGRFGSVKVFSVSMLGFGIFSALCGLAPSLGVLVAFRVCQGLMGGPLIPLSQTLLMSIFPKKDQPKAMALWAVTTLVAPVVGPILGGLLCDNYSWPMIFWVNVPIALLCAPVIFKALQPIETAIRKAKVDVVGLGLLIVWVSSLQIMLDIGKEHEWFASPMIIALAVVAVIGLAAFLIWELTEAEPIVPLRVFRHRGYAASMIALPLVFGGFFGANVLTPLWLQTNMGYTATWAGYATGMTGILAILGAPIAAKASARFDPRMIICLGVSWLAVIAVFRGGATSQMDFAQISFWLFLTGLGMPLFFLPLTGLALASVDTQETAGAAGLMSFIRTFSGAIATALVNTVWEDRGNANQAQLVDVMKGTEQTVSMLEAGGMSHLQALQSVTNLAHGEAVTLATNEIFMACAVMFCIAAIVIWIVPKPAGPIQAGPAH
jgi:DHA2 family multidrug resistance protein